MSLYILLHYLRLYLFNNFLYDLAKKNNEWQYFKGEYLDFQFF